MSNRLPWFRCFPSALLGAMAGLEADDSLVYVTLLLRIYETGGPVHETARSLSRRTGLTERRAASALWRLIGQKKVTDLGDHLIDSESTHAEIQWQTERKAEQSSAGKASAAKRQKQPGEEKNEASGLADAVIGAEKTQQKHADALNGRSADDEQPLNQDERDKDRSQEKPTASPETRARESFPPRAFDEFWLRYPHKVGKLAAETSFDRVRKSGRVSYPVLMSGLDRYIASKPPDRSWCNPATWLNQGRYDDEPSVGNLFAGQPARDQHRGTSFDAITAGMARVAARRGLGQGGGSNGGGSGDARGHRTRPDDPEIEDADWTPAGGYSAAHH